MDSPLTRRPWWHRLRLSVRALTALVLVVGGGLGWFIYRAAVQRDAVRAITAAGGTVIYDFQQGAGALEPGGTPPGPPWLVGLLGVDCFADVIAVTIESAQTDAMLAHVGRLRRLERLDARSTRVTDSGLAHLAGLSELRVLACSGTPGLTDAGLAHLAGLGRLEVLWIEDTSSIEGPGLAHLAGLDRLRRLALHLVTDANLSGLSQLTGLRELSLSVERVTETALAGVARLPRLEELAFGGEIGSDAGMEHLRALTSLDVLQVYGPWFTDTGLAPVSEMDHLSNFFVSDTTSVTPVGLNHLQRQRPELRIGVNGSGRVGRARLDLLRGAVESGAILTEPH